MASKSSSRPVRWVPLGLILASMIGLQVVVVATAVALRLGLLRGHS